MTSHEIPPSPLKPDVTLIDIRCADLLGRRLLNIYGYQQQNVADLMDDESSWWLEFEYGIWATVKSIIAPAFVDTTFQLQFRFFHTAQFPLRNRALFAKNPPQLAPLLGLQLLEQMESVFDDAHLSIEALRLGFGNDNNITAELHIGYLDAVTGESWPGMGAKAIALAAARKAEPPQGHSVDRLIRCAQAISNAKQEKKATEQSAFWQSKWATPFHVARKITGVLLIALGLVLIWEMATMLSLHDLGGKGLFGFGGGALMLIMGGVLCLIAKRGEDALE